MKSYSFSMWSTKPIIYDKVDLTRQSLILLKDGKRIRNTFKRPEATDKPSNDQWCIDILEESCDLVCSCETVNGISEFQLYESEGDHLFSIGERMICGRILGKSNTTSTVTLKKGKYTLVPSFAENCETASMSIVFRGSSLFTISQITDWFNLDIHDEWTEENNKGYNRHTVSPQYLITLTKTSPLYLYLNTTCDDQVMIILYRSDGRYFDYHKECSEIEKSKVVNHSSKIVQSNLTPGNYIAELMAYQEKTTGPFIFTIQCPNDVIVKRCPELGEGYLHYHYDGKWCNNENNPIPVVFEEDNTELIMVYNPSGKESVDVSLYRDEGKKSPQEQLKKHPAAVCKLNNSYFRTAIPIVSEKAVISKGNYFIVPSTFDPFEGPISIDLFTDKPIRGATISEIKPVICSRLLRLDAELLYRQSFLYFSNSKLEKVSLTTNGNTKEENEEIELLRKQLYCCLGENMELNKKLNNLSLMSLDESLFNRKNENSEETLKAQLIEAQSKIDELNEKLNKQKNNENVDTDNNNSSRIMELLIELNRKNDYVIKLEKDLSKLNEKENENDIIIKELNRQLELLERNSNESLRKEKYNYLQEKGILYNQITKFEECANTLKKELNGKDEVIVRLENELKDSNEKLCKNDKRITELEEMGLIKDKSIEDLRKEKEKSEEDKKELMNKMKEKEEETNRLTKESEKERNNLNSVIDDLKKQINELKEEITEDEKLIKEQKDLCDNLDAKSKYVTEIEEENNGDGELKELKLYMNKARISVKAEKSAYLEIRSYPKPPPEKPYKLLTCCLYLVGIIDEDQFINGLDPKQCDEYYDPYDPDYEFTEQKKWNFVKNNINFDLVKKICEYDVLNITTEKEKSMLLQIRNVLFDITPEEINKFSKAYAVMFNLLVSYLDLYFVANRVKGLLTPKELMNKIIDKCDTSSTIFILTNKILKEISDEAKDIIKNNEEDNRCENFINKTTMKFDELCNDINVVNHDLQYTIKPEPTDVEMNWQEVSKEFKKCMKKDMKTIKPFNLQKRKSLKNMKKKK